MSFSVKVLGEDNSGSWGGITEGVVYVNERVREAEGQGEDNQGCHQHVTRWLVGQSDTLREYP